MNKSYISKNSNSSSHDSSGHDSFTGKETAASNQENHEPDDWKPADNKQSFTRLKKSFLSINSKRLQRMRDALTSRHKQVLDALPMLLHYNHPMMPGFVSRNTPHKISNFTPARSDQQAVKSIARSFTYHPEVNEPESIVGVFIMGSVSTIAQSEKSDLDIWLCHRPDLPQSAINELNLKVKGISEWAAQSKLEIHFFLMNAEAFHDGELSLLDEESSGSAQQHLLLDEFYRSAIYLCGKTPLWWLISSNANLHYTDHANQLLRDRHVQKNETIDFGDVANIPAQEFIGAGIWQLYKAIDSPYKSVLKLLLLEAYVNEYPKIEPLAQTFKKLVHEGCNDINELDSYILVYRRIEKYLLSKNQTKRLELARRCFYLKINKPLSQPFRGREKSWQRLILEKLVIDWSWSAEHIKLMDQHAEWKSPEIIKERSMLVTELTRSYRMLLDFSHHVKAGRTISTEELIILGRKLNATFERRPGKIDCFNANHSADLREGYLSLIEHQSQSSGERVWSCFNKNFNQKIVERPEPLKSPSSFTELVVWASANGIATLKTHFDIKRSPSIEQEKLDLVLSTVHQWLNFPLKPVPHHNFKDPAQPSKVLILLNAAKEPEKKGLHKQGLQRISDQSDALSYGAFKENMIFSIDIITLNSWNEIETRQFIGYQSLIETLLDYLEMCLPGTHQKPPKLTVQCISAQYRTAMTRRVQQWFTHIADCFYKKHPPSTRYIFQLGQKTYCLQFHNMKPSINEFNSDDALLEHLGNEQKKYSPIVFDPETLQGHPLRIVAETAIEKSICVCFRLFDLGMEIFVVDEKGSIIHSFYRGRKDHNPLIPLHKFIRSVLHRQILITDQLNEPYDPVSIKFFQLIATTTKRFSIKEHRLPTETTQVPNFEIKATAWRTELHQPDATEDLTTMHNRSELHYDFSCEGESFSSDKYGKNTFKVTAEYILSLRKTMDSYPVYISDLDLTLQGNGSRPQNRMQTSHYLRVKSSLEYQLNRALKAINRQ